MVASGKSADMHVLERGDGRPIIFVHGWPTNGNIWKYQVDALADEFHVLAVDLPGFGATPPVARPSMEAFARAIREYIEHRQLSSVFLIGWSMGAGVVMSYLEHFGSHGLSGIGIVDDCPKLLPSDDWRAEIDTTFTRETVDRWRKAWEAGERRSVIAELTTSEFKDPERHAATIDWAIEESLRCDPPSAIAALVEVMELDFRPSLKTVDVPALLLYGEYSQMTTPATRAFMESTIPNATLVVFGESGHNPMIEEAERFNAEVRAFVRAL
jgi:pimeloyl-ACP methyl ester carboxylesterase